MVFAFNVVKLIRLIRKILMLKYKLLTSEVTRWLKGICPNAKKKDFPAPKKWVNIAG